MHLVDNLCVNEQNKRYLRARNISDYYNSISVRRLLSQPREITRMNGEITGQFREMISVVET